MGSLDFPFLHGHWRSSDCNCRGGSRAVFLRDVIVGYILVGHSGWLVTLPVLKAPGRSSERAPPECPLSGGEFNESTQHLLILADEEVCEWRGMHGPGSRRNRRLSCGSAGRAVNVWRTSRERLRGGTRAASIGSSLAMEGLLQRHAGGLW